MRRPLPAVLLTCTLLACGGESTPAQPDRPAPAQVAPPAPAAPMTIEASKPEVAKPKVATPGVAKPEVAQLEVIKPEDPKPEDPTLEPVNAATTATPPELTPPPPGDPVALPPPPAIAIQPWTSVAHTTTWTLRAEPAEPVKFVDLNAGVLGQAGSQWFRVGEDGQLAAFTMDTQPKPPILGVWPSDAWYVDQRFVKYSDGEEEEGQEYLELRLMKLRAGKRWVPQVYSGTGEAWWHPGTDDWEEAHISTLSGMLVYNGSLTTMKRVAGKHPDPDIGPHRGDVITFLETGAGKTYLLSRDADGYYAQTACDDDPCVAESVRKLPLDKWKFGRQLTRGRHSVSVIATSEAREFILHNRGKPDGWTLDELPAGERPTGMWASQEGGLWSITGERLRWRDIKGVWRDVALPEGLGAPTVAVSEDRQQLWVSGVVAGAAKVFSAPANVQAPAAPAP